MKQRQRSMKLPSAIVTIAEPNRGNNDWIVVDTGDVMVHIFSAGARRYYDLDELWIGNGTFQVRLSSSSLPFGVLTPSATGTTRTWPSNIGRAGPPARSQRCTWRVEPI